jgi:hypothetical protein
VDRAPGLLAGSSSSDADVTTREPYNDVQRTALKAAVAFGVLGVALIAFGALHFVGVIRGGTTYGVIFCGCGALSLWITGRVFRGVHRERARAASPELD